MKKDFVVTEQTARWIELHDSMDVIWRGIESGLEEVTGEPGKAKEAFESDFYSHLDGVRQGLEKWFAKSAFGNLDFMDGEPRKI